jgi:hypothetical protein
MSQLSFEESICVICGCDENKPCFGGNPEYCKNAFKEYESRLNEKVVDIMKKEQEKNKKQMVFVNDDDRWPVFEINACGVKKNKLREYDMEYEGFEYIVNGCCLTHASILPGEVLEMMGDLKEEEEDAKDKNTVGLKELFEGSEKYRKNLLDYRKKNYDYTDKVYNKPSKCLSPILRNI